MYEFWIDFSFFYVAFYAFFKENHQTGNKEKNLHKWEKFRNDQLYLGSFKKYDC